VKFLYDHPEGLDPPINAANCKHVKNCKQFSTVVAKKGDVILLHGLVPHAASPNYLHYARVISNPHVSLRRPYNLNRPDGNYVSPFKQTHSVSIHAS
jgi:ectoine hydroxylase-related dioxygenase (phytanoyl-CoA dioxygenase family)